MKMSAVLLSIITAFNVVPAIAEGKIEITEIINSVEGGEKILSGTREASFLCKNRQVQLKPKWSEGQSTELSIVINDGKYIFGKWFYSQGALDSSLSGFDKVLSKINEVEKLSLSSLSRQVSFRLSQVDKEWISICKTGGQLRKITKITEKKIIKNNKSSLIGSQKSGESTERIYDDLNDIEMRLMQEAEDAYSLEDAKEEIKTLKNNT